MKTKIVFALTSDNSDIFLERTLVAVYSTRKHNPDAFILLATDRRTIDTCDSGLRKDFLDYFNEILIIDTTEFPDKKSRSRQVKTSLGTSIEGDFIYIDCDTIITGALDMVDEIPHNIALARDMHIDVADRDMIFDKKRFDDLGYLESQKYIYNGGVILARDCDDRHRLFSAWNSEWRKSYADGVTIDQPALHRAMRQTGAEIGLLPDILNLQISGFFIPYLSNALVIHTYTNADNFTAYLLKDDIVYKRIKDEGAIPPDTLYLINNAKTAFDKFTLPGDRDDAFIRIRTKIYYRARFFYQNDKAFFKALEGLSKVLVGVYLLKEKISGFFKRK